MKRIIEKDIKALKMISALSEASYDMILFLNPNQDELFKLLNESLLANDVDPMSTLMLPLF